MPLPTQPTSLLKKSPPKPCPTCPHRVSDLGDHQLFTSPILFPTATSAKDIDHSKILIEDIEHLSLDGTLEFAASSTISALIVAANEPKSAFDRDTYYEPKAQIKSAINPTSGAFTTNHELNGFTDAHSPKNSRSSKDFRSYKAPAVDSDISGTPRDPWWDTPTGQYMLRIDPISGGFVPRPDGYTGFTLPYISRQLRYPDESEGENDKITAPSAEGSQMSTMPANANEHRLDKSSKATYSLAPTEIIDEAKFSGIMPPPNSPNRSNKGENEDRYGNI